MGHYDDQREADRLQQIEVENRWWTKKIYKQVMSGYYDKFFDVAKACGMTYVQIPVEDARRLINIVRQQAVLETLQGEDNT